MPSELGMPFFFKRGQPILGLHATSANKPAKSSTSSPKRRIARRTSSREPHLLLAAWKGFYQPTFRTMPATD